MASRRVTVIRHLLATWFLYNLSLFFTLIITCDRFNHNELETLGAMAIFTVGLTVMQYDMWVIRRNKFKRDADETPLN